MNVQIEANMKRREAEQTSGGIDSHALEGLAHKRTTLVSRCADLQSRIDEQVRACVSGDHGPND